MEVWKDIPGYEGNYQASNLGNIKSLRRSYMVKGVYPSVLKEKILKLCSDKDGYLRVCLSKEGKIKYRAVHQLVLESFVGPKLKGNVCCHWNGINTDNRIENLRWDSERANAQDAIRHGTHPGFLKKGRNNGIFGEKSKQAKLSNNQVIEIKKLLLDKKLSQARIGKMFNVDRLVISRIARGVTWKYINAA